MMHRMIRPLLAPAALALILGNACSPSATTPVADRADGGDATPRPRPLLPRTESSADVDPDSQSGQQVFVTDEGFRPALLFSVIGEEISFVNETDGTVTVEFAVLDFTSGPIDPGSEATYTPRGAYSIVYHLAEDPRTTARIQVEPYFNPGEDPAAENRLDADTPGEGREDQVWR